MKEHLDLLVVDDDQAISKIFKDLVAKEAGVEVSAAGDGATALEMLNEKDFEIAVVDVNMPGIDGLQLLEQIKKIKPCVEVVMLTGHGTIETAVKAIKLGAVDFLTKPFKVSQIMTTINRVKQIKGLRDENRLLKEQLMEKYRSVNMIGLTPPMMKVNETIDRIRNEECNVLITGESGTGKDIVARAIHFDGIRKDGPFVAVDCASIHKNLLESELFGHAKGSFTGAYAKKDGLLVRGDKGTVFLDEIAELPIDLQPALLRCLEERKVRPVGSTQLIDIDVRLIAATNRDLYGMMGRGEFRQDLFYRLNVVMIHLPPLRERKDDIPLLAKYFIDKLNARFHKKKSGLTNDALHMLLRYDWQGNVRELEHVMERAFALGGPDEISIEDLPPTIVDYARQKSAGPAPVASNIKKSLGEAETEIILKTLEETDYDTSKTARILKIDRSTVYRKLKRSNITISRLAGS